MTARRLCRSSRSWARCPRCFQGFSYRRVLSDALKLGEGALAAHVFESEVVAWGSVSSACDALLLRERLSRANGALGLCSFEGRLALADQLTSFVLLADAETFHVGARVSTHARTSLFMSFASGASYGQSVASLSVGVSALSRSLAG